jgi:hypothetical protein
MLNYEQGRRTVIELFAPIRANVDTHLAAARTDPLGL